MKTEIVHVGNTQAQFSEVADIKLSPVVRQFFMMQTICEEPLFVIIKSRRRRHE